MTPLHHTAVVTKKQTFYENSIYFAATISLLITLVTLEYNTRRPVAERCIDILSTGTQGHTTHVIQTE